MRVKEEAVSTLKDSLTSRFGDGFKALVEAEVEGRLAGRKKLDREDLDAIERVLVAARKERRGGGTIRPRKTLSRSLPNLSAIDGASPPTPPPLQRLAPTAPSALESSLGRPRPMSSGTVGSRASGGHAAMARSMSETKVRRPPPFGTSILDDDTGSERSRVQVVPRYPVPKRPKLKPMDHWDLIVAFDTMKHREEDSRFRQEGKHKAIAKFKDTLDTQMMEFHGMQDQERRNKEQCRQDMLNQVEENRRIAAAEKHANEVKKIKMKEVNDECMAAVNRRRQAEEDKKQRDQDLTTAWLESERLRMKQQKEDDDREHARKCQQGKDEMAAAQAEAERRRQARLADEKAGAAGAQKDMDDKVAANRKAVQDRMDQIDRNCKSIGAGIADRDAKAEAELQAKIKRVQEESDRAAKEDADHRKSVRDGKVKDMTDTLHRQMQNRKDEAKREVEEGVKQAELFRQQFKEGLQKDHEKEERARQARGNLDTVLITHIRSNQSVHPKDFGAHLTQKQELAYNRGLFEQMAVEGFEKQYTHKFLPQATHTGTGKTDPYPSVGRWHGGDFSSLELHHPDVG